MAVKLLKLPEVSVMTGLPESTLRFMRTTGYGPRSARVGRRVMYREDDVLSWIDEQFETDAARHCGAVGTPHATQGGRTLHRH